MSYNNLFDLFKLKKQMMRQEFLPFLSFPEIAHLSQLNQQMKLFTDPNHQIIFTDEHMKINRYKKEDKTTEEKSDKKKAVKKEDKEDSDDKTEEKSDKKKVVKKEDKDDKTTEEKSDKKKTDKKEDKEKWEKDKEIRIC